MATAAACLVLLAAGAVPAGARAGGPVAAPLAAAAPAPAVQGRDNRWLAVATLGTGLLAIGGILVYLHSVQRRYYELVGQAIGTLGTVPNASAVAPFMGDTEAVAAPTARIEGPKAIVVGRPASFRVAVDGMTTPGQWAVEPADAADVAATDEPGVVTVTARRAGELTLTAQPAEPAGIAPAALTVSAVELQAAPGAVPFVGGGYGTVLLAALLVTVAAALGMLDVLSGEAVAGFLGAVAGYVFLRAATDTTAGAGKPADGSAAP